MASEELSDEAVARTLKEEAKSRAIKYSTLGLQAFLPTRAASAAPKPNTRFLRNILRETDSHNAALVAKEQREARARRKVIEKTKPSSQAETTRKSKDSDAFANGHSRKRRRIEEYSRRDRSRSPKRGRSHTHKHADIDLSQDNTGRLSRYLSVSSVEGDTSHHCHRDKNRRRSKERSAQRKDRDDGRKRRRDHRRRDGGSPRSRSQSPRQHGRHSRRPKEGEYRRSRSPSDLLKRSRRKEKSKSKSLSPNRQSPASETSSDPLDDIIGPRAPKTAPKVHSRGRGVFASNSTAMDERFASSYDPSADVQPNSDEDDWDQALEALRARQKWNQMGAERLKAAGFSAEEVKKWEKGGDKDESDVRWAKKGEGREWDRGKVIDEDGNVNLEPEWGRLKGT